MSLINEALKKAQRSRGDSPDSAGMVVGEVLVAKRRPPTSAKMILLYAAGSLVAFVLCVVGAVYYLNRPAPRPPAPTPAPRPVAKSEPAATPAVNVPGTNPTAPAPAAATPTTPAAAPVAKAPVTAAPATLVTPPAPTPVTPPVAEKVATASTPTPPVTSPADSPAGPATVVTPAPDAIANAPATAAPKPAATPKADERIQVYLETLRITAVRALGSSDSRVMMSDRVYRVNDIVERTLGLRLTKVEANQLTFTDMNGVAYVKYF